MGSGVDELFYEDRGYFLRKQAMRDTMRGLEQDAAEVLSNVYMDRRIWKYIVCMSPGMSGFLFILDPLW